MNGDSGKSCGLKVKSLPWSMLLASLPALCAAVAVLAVFPRAEGVFATDVRLRSRTHATCSFVALDPTAEKKAMEDVRSTLSRDLSGVREMSADLSVSTIPDPPYEAITDISDRSRPLPPHPFSLSPVPFAPSLSAPDAEQIEPDERGEPPAFSREELLQNTIK